VEDENLQTPTQRFVTITGHDIHPGQAKNVMINAVRAAAAVVEPAGGFPAETTAGRQPYLHPYSMSGDVSSAQLKLLVRAFGDDELREREDVLRGILRAVEARLPAWRSPSRSKNPIATCALTLQRTRRSSIRDRAVQRQGFDSGPQSHPRWHRRVAIVRNGSTDAEPLCRWPSHSLCAGVGVVGMDGGRSGVCLQLLSVWVERSG